MTIIYICTTAVLTILLAYLTIWNEKLSKDAKEAKSEADRLIDRIVTMSRNTETVIAEYTLTESDYLLSPKKMDKRVRERLLSNLALKIAGVIDDTPAFNEETKTYYYEITIIK